MSETKKKYFGRWKSRDEMIQDFFYGEETPADFPQDHQILFANYGGGSYDGAALVVYIDGVQLYRVEGSHCSCYGLEGQWEPEKELHEVLCAYQPPYYDFDADALARFRELFPYSPLVKATT